MEPAIVQADSAAERSDCPAADPASLAGPALVAQGIERRFPEPCVAGSNPAEGASGSCSSVAIRGARSPSTARRVTLSRPAPAASEHCPFGLPSLRRMTAPFIPPSALVTGANRGIGLEVCRQLAGLGSVVYLGARDIEAGESAARGTPY